MENSSKALIIIAAILIAIILISIGMSIVKSSSDISDTAQDVSKNKAVSTFNSRFLCYVSNKTSGAHAKALTSRVIANNQKDGSFSSFQIDNHQIFLNLYKKDGTDIKHKWKALDLQEIYQNISDTSNYEIRVTTGCTYLSPSSPSIAYYKGYVYCMSIEEL